MEAHLCNHPKVPHTVVYKIGKHGEVATPFVDLEEADLFAQKIIRQNSPRLGWLKVYRSDNDAYVCFRWDNPQEEKNVAETQKVKLEVDMEPLASAFDNVAQGFRDHGKSIRLLWGSQVGVTIIVFGDILMRALR